MDELEKTGVLCERRIKKMKKGKVFKSVMKTTENNLIVAEMWMLRYTIGKTSWDRVRNNNVEDGRPAEDLEDGNYIGLDIETGGSRCSKDAGSAGRGQDKVRRGSGGTLHRRRFV